jgi:hypothetical protein
MLSRPRSGRPSKHERHHPKLRFGANAHPDSADENCKPPTLSIPCTRKTGETRNPNLPPLPRPHISPMNIEPHPSAMSGLRPVSWPPTDLPVSTLWDRARMLFMNLLSFIGSAFALATTRFTRRQHTELINRIQPIEFLLRALFYLEALLFLKTPAGQGLRATAKPLPRFTQRPRATRAAATRTQAETATEPATALNAKPPTFAVFHWPRIWYLKDDTPRPRDKANRIHMQLSQLRARQLHADDALMSERASVALGRRVLAIRHALENREALISKLARYIARVPPAELPPGFPDRTVAARWWHGRPEYFNACALARAITRAIFLALPRRWEPG